MTLGELGHLLPRRMRAYGVGYDGSPLGVVCFFFLVVLGTCKYQAGYAGTRRAGASGAGSHISAAECHDGGVDGAVEAFLVLSSCEGVRGVLLGSDVAEVEAA